MASIKTWLLFVGLFYYSDGYKFMVVIPLMSKSHAILGEGAVRHLLNDGHEVTYVTTFPYKHGIHPNLREVDVSSIKDVMQHIRLNFQLLVSNQSTFNDHIDATAFTTPLSQATLENPTVKEIIYNPNEHFDAVIVEWSYNELLAGLATIFDCPLIWLSPIELDWVMLDLLGTPSNPAYTASITSFNEHPFTFSQRIEELWTQIRVRFYKYMYYDEIEKDLYEKLVAPVIRKRGRNPPSYYDVQYNASLILGNTYVSTGLAIAEPLNYKAIAGYYIDDKVSPLPENLQKIFDNAKHGVIYFSLGTTMTDSGMPEPLRKSLLQMFSTLNQTVIWKFGKEMTDLPKNVHVLKFAPQFSVLSHANCKVFVTHGGLLSTTEAVHFAVPIVGIPTFLDQYYNINRVVKKGIGRRVVISSPSFTDDLKLAIEEVINNPSYATKVKELSFIYHDRPVSPGAELVHWVKHVVHTRGALHLRSPAARVPIYQLLYLDLIILILVLFKVGQVVYRSFVANCYIRAGLTQKKID